MSTFNIYQNLQELTTNAILYWLVITDLTHFYFGSFSKALFLPPTKKIPTKEPYTVQSA